MGLANLVPGISGGTMLLAAGVYPAFIRAVAELTTFRFRRRSLVLLGAVAAAAATAILLLAGPVRTLVLEQRWAMYSLFIGLTLGGVPLVWKLARPATPAVWAGAAAGLALMLLMAFGPAAHGAAATGSAPLLLVSGMAGAGAMILPGVSGGYLLLLLGQYLPILGAVDQLKQVLLGLAHGPLDGPLLGHALAVLVPVGIGVGIGLVGVSNLLRLALERFRQATLGVLLGLLLGAVAGLWPFQEPVAPRPGDLHVGRILSAQDASELPVEEWPLARFSPTAGQILASLALIGGGLLTTGLIARWGRDADESPSASAAG